MAVSKRRNFGTIGKSNRKTHSHDSGHSPLELDLLASQNTPDMTWLWVAWVAAALAILLVAGAAGIAIKGTIFGVLVDSRGRCSLSRFKITWWTTIVVSLVAGVTVGRFHVVGTEVLGFTIPTKVLSLLSVAASTAVVSTALKSYKDKHHPESISATPLAMAYLGQMLTVEEGAQADQTLDVGKLQSLLVTIVLGLGYILTCVHEFLGDDPAKVTGPAGITALPDLNVTFVALLAVSGAYYIGMKAVPRDGLPALSLPDVGSSEAIQRATDVAAGLPLDGKSVLRRRKAATHAARRAARREVTAGAAAGAGPQNGRGRAVGGSDAEQQSLSPRVGEGSPFPQPDPAST